MVSVICVWAFWHTWVLSEACRRWPWSPDIVGGCGVGNRLKYVSMQLVQLGGNTWCTLSIFFRLCIHACTSRYLGWCMFFHKRIDQHMHVTDHHALNAKGQVATSGWRGCCIPDPHWCFFILRTTQSSPVSIQTPANDIQFQGCTSIIRRVLE